MPKQPLIIKYLSLDRSPGLRGGLAPYRDLASHINVVLGANASGKSSTARAIQELIWRHGGGGTIATARVELEGQDWELSVEGGKGRARRNGVEEQPAGIPAWEGRSRYMLALHELVASEDGDLAQQVVNDSQGYNLRAAEGTLRYSWGGLTRRNGQYQAYEAAKADYDSVFGLQNSLHRQQQQLERLDREKKEAEKAGRLLEWSRQLIEFDRARQLLAKAEAQLVEMPEVLKDLTGNEYDDLNDLKNYLTKLDGRIGDQQIIIDTSIDSRAALQLPENGVPGGLLGLLEEKITALGHSERRITENEQELAAAVTTEREALRPLGAGQDFSGWEGVKWMDVETLDEHFRNLLGLLDRKGALEELLTEFERSIVSEGLPDQEKLTNGIHALTAWLQEQRPEVRKSLPSWAIRLMTGLALLPAVAVWLFHEAGLLSLLLVAAGVAIIQLTGKEGDAGASSLRESDFRSTGLPEPSNWNVAAIQERLSELVDQLGLSRWQRQVSGRLAVYRKELAAMTDDEKVYAQRYEELRVALQLVPQAPVGDITSYSGMYWFLYHAANWHRLHLKRMGLDQEVSKVKEQQQAQLAEINQLLEAMELGPASDSMSARMFRNQLADKDTVWRQARDAMKNAKANLAEHQMEFEQGQAKLQGIYAMLGVAVDEDDRVRELAGKVADFRAVNLERDRCLTLVSERERLLKENALFADHLAEMDNIDIPAIESRTPGWRAQAENLDFLKEEIANIRLAIRQAERGNTVETALKRKEDSVAALETEYDTQLHAMTGKLLVEALKRQADERDRPAVFRVANTLFGQITHGRYQLRLNSDEPPAFGAFDTVDQQWRNLNELSTGTRIQLLLSVRLAFIDSLEPSVRLPIIADELLANSDPRRAEAIMAALVEISREGRQVFYFTSQETELVKWQELLKDKQEITRKMFVLNGQESNGYHPPSEPLGPTFLDSYRIDSVPESGSLNHTQYGEVLRPRAFNLMTDSPERLHIWYFFEDPQVVNTLLNRGLSFWGQLRTYIANGGRLKEIDQGTIEKAADKAAILGRFLELYRQGRPYPIDRSVLENSEFVSGTFIDRVADVLTEVDNNPEKLLNSLSNKAVSGFLSRNIGFLRDHFLEEGYISEEPVLEAEEIRVQLTAIISHTQVGNEEAQKFLARVLGER